MVGQGAWWADERAVVRGGTMRRRRASKKAVETYEEKEAAEEEEEPGGQGAGRVVGQAAVCKRAVRREMEARWVVSGMSRVWIVYGGSGAAQLNTVWVPVERTDCCVISTHGASTTTPP